MRSSRSILQVSALGFAAAASCNETEIQWASCPAVLGYPDTVKCGSLAVPRDYTFPDSNETIALSIVKIPATKQPAKGSILFNFGGPGIAGGATLVLNNEIPALTGNEYDLVTFDPRGTGNTLPMECFVSDGEAVRFGDDNLLANASEVQLGRLWARGQVDAWTCQNRGGDDARLISTAFTARDTMRIVDALGDDDKMLRFWGMSYGTTLGATVAAMFPDRVDKLILDGVQNPHDYYHAQATYQQWASADAHFSQFFEHCIAAGAAKCPLAAFNMTASQLEDATYAAFEALKSNPVALQSAVGAPPTIVDYSTAKGLTFSNTYDARSGWPLLGVYLAQVLAAAPSAHNVALPAPANNLSIVPDQTKESLINATTAQAQRGIQCLDNQVRTPTLSGFANVLPDSFRVSRLLGDINTGIHTLCTQWRITPAEVYTGNFDVDMTQGGKKVGALVLANSYDAQTSIESARNISATFEGSVMLETEGFGHAALSNPSRCAAEVIRSYWTKDELPEKGKVCGSTESPFLNTTWTSVLEGF